jgi:DNA-binding response OmpR family regulator
MTTAESRPAIPLSRDEYYREVVRLRDRVSWLEEENRLLRETFAPQIVFPFEWNLTKSERNCLAALASAPEGYCSREALELALYGLDDDVPAKTVEIFILRMRRKLAPHHIEIATVWGDGYRLPPPSLARVRAAMGGV